jgi:hypothetical protein
MYRFSRSIYRDLAPYVVEGPVAAGSNGHAGPNGHANGNGNGHANGNAVALGNGHAIDNRKRLLDACEAAMRRLVSDGRYFAHPARSLFSEVRMYFPIREQDRVFNVIDRNMKLAVEHLAQLPAGAAALDGQPSECRAHTRKGTPCQRQPLPGRDYCPSHKHLEESFEFEQLGALEPHGAETFDAAA